MVSLIRTRDYPNPFPLHITILDPDWQVSPWHDQTTGCRDKMQQWWAQKWRQVAVPRLSNRQLMFLWVGLSSSQRPTHLFVAYWRGAVSLESYSDVSVARFLFASLLIFCFGPQISSLKTSHPSCSLFTNEEMYYYVPNVPGYGRIPIKGAWYLNGITLRVPLTM